MKASRNKFAPKAKSKTKPKAGPKTKPKAGPKAGAKGPRKADPKFAPKDRGKADPETGPKAASTARPKVSPNPGPKPANKAKPKSVPPRARRRHDPSGLTIVYEDRDILVVDKEAGLLTMGTDREKSNTAYSALTDYVRKGNSKSRERVFIVHRLDREVSGILVFARSVQAKRTLQDNWEAVEKHYLALVQGLPLKGEGVFSSHLMEDGVHRMQSTKDAKLGKLSRTAYKVLGHSKGVTLLDINLLTGRKHQIRVHLADAKIPLLGDKKYGNVEIKGPSRLALHAYSIAFTHPYTGEFFQFETQIPALFAKVPRSRKG